MRIFFPKKNPDNNKASGSSALDLLNEIVIMVEENSSHLPKMPAKTKGKFISKLYELVLKFPPAQQQLFLKSFIEGVQILK